MRYPLHFSCCRSGRKIVHVDLATMDRTLKDSAGWYSKVIQDRSLEEGVEKGPILCGLHATSTFSLARPLDSTSLLDMRGVPDSTARWCH